MNPEILFSLSYGMYAIGTKGENFPNACIVNTVTQITSDPFIISVSVHHNNYTNEMIKNTGEFSVSVLSEQTPGPVIGALGYSSGRDKDKLQNIHHKILLEGMPVIQEEICCWFLCKLVNSVETSTHTVFFGEIIAGSENYYGIPMTYRYFREVIKGKSPKNAPTYHDPNAKIAGSQPMTSYICTVCGYVYTDGETPFGKLSDEWVCPVCDAPRSAFIIK
ncbi:MAG: flavin reductase [Bacillota bacterium]|nr:flavin reductase [Bacillota bacterium]